PISGQYPPVIRPPRPGCQFGGPIRPADAARDAGPEQTGLIPVLAGMTDDRRITPDLQSPPPGSPEAHARGCPCTDPCDAPDSAGRGLAIDENCPVHGAAAIAGDRAGEAGPIATEGDIVDAAAAPELRQDR